jgi:hypothetical protein
MACRPHIVYQFEAGGVSLKAQETPLICRYTKDGLHAAQVIQNSFQLFLKKELRHIAQYLRSDV